jgi:hypothetical protein
MTKRRAAKVIGGIWVDAVVAEQESNDLDLAGPGGMGEGRHAILVIVVWIRALGQKEPNHVRVPVLGGECKWWQVEPFTVGDADFSAGGEDLARRANPAMLRGPGEDSFAGANPNASAVEVRVEQIAESFVGPGERTDGALVCPGSRGVLGGVGNEEYQLICQIFELRHFNFGSAADGALVDLVTAGADSVEERKIAGSNASTWEMR